MAAVVKSERGRWFPSIAEAKKRYAHGTHARYVLGRCRCSPCGEATRAYEVNRKAAHQDPYVIEYSGRAKKWFVRELATSAIVARYKVKISAQRKADTLNAERTASTQLIPVAEVVAHIRMLQSAGIGVNRISRASTVASSVITRMLVGDIARTRRSTAAKIFSVTVDAIAGGARMRADETVVLIDRLVRAGYTRGWIAMELGLQVPAIQAARSGWIRVDKARAIFAIYNREAKANRKIGPVVPFKIGEVESSLARFHGQRPEGGMVVQSLTREHGTAARYDSGCRCKGCAAAKARAEDASSRRRGLRYLMRREGKSWLVFDTTTGALSFKSRDQSEAIALRDTLNLADPRAAGRVLTDAGPVRQHLKALVADGTALSTIADASGVSRTQVLFLLEGKSRRTARSNAASILTLTPGHLPKNGRIDASASFELLDRMLAVGFDREWVCTILDIPKHSFRQRTQSIAFARARDLASLYAHLQDRVPALRAIEHTSQERLAS